ncbi:MAG: RNA methyltransferase [Bacteroidetes bacterium]|nr:RNA methyltransferase [Bacteroidota bacterium]
MYESLTRQAAVDLGKLHRRKAREEQRCFIIEGERLIGEALAAGARIASVIVTHERVERFAPLLAGMEAAGVPVLLANAPQFGKISDTRQPQGIAAVAELPEPDVERTLRMAPDGMPLPVLWQITDPGNMGTIIRTTDWFGGGGLLYSSGSVDPWNPKTVRASMGSLFRVQLGEVSSAAEIQTLAHRSGREVAAVVVGDGTPLHDYRPGGRELLLFGNEAHGLPQEVLDLATHRIHIPGGGVESLNLAVAYGIVLHALGKKESRVRSGE